jgi:hypothetical protein
MSHVSAPVQSLVARRTTSGGWSYYRKSPQTSVEATALAVMALSAESLDATRLGIAGLVHLQHRDGGWPAFQGDSDSSWTTALVLCALNGIADFVSARDRAFDWIIAAKGQEAHWFWRWKFKTVDRNVHFDPDKYGWPWSHGAASWVIPTSLSVVALKQFTACNRTEPSEKRIRLGVDMLQDRACLGGGWNSGNSIVYGVPLPAHIEATAIALLALQDEKRTPAIRASLGWLKQSSASIASVESLAWCILSLFVYQERVGHLQARLATLVGDGHGILNNATLATALLALKCGEMIHPFMVLR